MRRQILFAVVLLTAVLLAACAAAAAPTPPPAAVEAYAPARDLSLPESAGSGQQKNSVATGNAQAPAAQERLVIQNADLVLVVKDPQAKVNAIGALAVRLGGFVVSSNTYQTSAANDTLVPEATITIRVPAKDIETALTEIKAEVVELRSENRSGQDVTDQYVDLQSRLKARQAAEAQLLKMMEQSTNAEDTLAIFNQLIQIQSEIEVLKGQIKYYEEAAAMSAISVRILAEEGVQPLQIGGWRPQGVARDALQALINFVQGFVNFLIWLVIFIIPVAAVVIAMLGVLWRLLRWFWRKIFPKKTPPPSPPPVQPAG